MQKKILQIESCSREFCTIVILLAAVILVSGCAGNNSKLTSMHHSSIIIEWVESGRSAEKNAADFNNIATIVNEWANQAGFFLLTPDQHAKIQQAWVPVKRDGRAKAVYYHERNPQKSGWPIELLLAYDPSDNPPRVQIAITEGYGKKPSERLQAAHAALSERLVKRYGKNVEALIW